ncbi:MULTISPECIES: hypothetical protein [unclassified Pseudoalteromonas]|uniref:hypothetical protein n=1 Tax=unclassified Pseudoalteromonas TaxID=194690 RepID=UPI0020970160|nr:hypothetical protein [Pseudoalteromonas sp. XMcav2-N]MCO7188543.1 hypothetical protein [Pseudoalteromonas sp. XMcav2-N]
MSASTTASLDALVNENSICAGPLPEALQFTYLKNEGIEQLKALAGEVWSNYNDSDPGVTILEQVVYALTELGYVNTFDIADVLTQPDGNINYQHQFFAPQDILTTGPVTGNDYRKLVVDTIAGIDNIYLQPLISDAQSTGLYQVWLYSQELLTANQTGTSNLQAVCNEVSQLLNKNRNLGEYFLLPQVLQSQEIVLSAKVLLEQGAAPEQVYLDIQQALADYISPDVKRLGYQQARSQGFSSGEIFDGPRLNNGWIPGDNPLGAKRDVVQVVDLITLISQVSGVAAVESFRLDESESKDSVDIAPDKVAVLQLGDEFSLIQHQTPLNQAPWQQTHLLSQLERTCHNQSVSALTDMAPQMPTGLFRDIESYFSIQNTFPDIYAIGHNSLESDAPAYRVAQARQLKGYLLLFDQILANQFSQLANLGNLFSFSFDIVPTSQQMFYQQRTDSTPDHPPAIPSQRFIRSYFYQPIYDVPNVQALLKGQQQYRFYNPDEPKDSNAHDLLAWQRFINDPFNQYNHGLGEIIESQQDAGQRRDEMLSHLLARHGELAQLYDDIIDASQWYGSKLQTRIIVKTIWLQNLQALSYQRVQAIKFAMAEPLPTPGRYRIGQADYNTLMNSKSERFTKVVHSLYLQGFADQRQIIKAISASLVKQLARHVKLQGKNSKVDLPKVVQQSRTLAAAIPMTDGNAMLLNNSQQRLKLDGEYDSQALDTYGKLSVQDFRNFSAFELKFDLLLGFTAHLRALAGALVTLMNDGAFETWLEQTKTSSSDQGSVTCVVDDITASKHTDMLVISISGKTVLELPNPGGAWQLSDLQVYVDQMAWLCGYRKGAVLVEHTLLQSAVVTPLSYTPDSDPWYFLKASLVLPSYVSLVNQEQFVYFIRALQQVHWPSHVQLRLLVADVNAFNALIMDYCSWYNQQRLVDRDPKEAADAALQTQLKETLLALLEVDCDHF